MIFLSVFVHIYKPQTREQLCPALFATSFSFLPAAEEGHLLDPSGWSCTRAAAELCVEPLHQQRAPLYTQSGCGSSDGFKQKCYNTENKALKMKQWAQNTRIFSCVFLIYFKLIKWKININNSIIIKDYVQSCESFPASMFLE